MIEWQSQLETQNSEEYSLSIFSASWCCHWCVFLPHKQKVHTHFHTCYSFPVEVSSDAIVEPLYPRWNKSCPVTASSSSGRSAPCHCAQGGWCKWKELCEKPSWLLHLYRNLRASEAAVHTLSAPFFFFFVGVVEARNCRRRYYVQVNE